MDVNNTALHIIDDDGALAEKSGLITFLSQRLAQQPPAVAAGRDRKQEGTPLNEIGCNYHVVGVFGGQSSGKSTLLNNTFGTKFQTMNAEKGRQQTTKGAFLSFADEKLQNNRQGTDAGEGSATPLGGPLLVVDFEGTDGVERGDDQTFERQLSLFALSVADTLIVNMWTHEVGRFNAANMSLLRTVFEVNLQLFSHNTTKMMLEKPTLLFILRDCTSGKDLKPRLAETLLKSLEKIWGSINRPAGLEDKESVSDLFSIRFFFMSHYELQREEFDAEVDTLQGMFFCTSTSTTSEGNTAEDGKGNLLSASDRELLNTNKPFFESRSCTRAIPLLDLPTYLENCWKSIKSSKDLDIPSQRDILARFRCGELASESRKNFSAKMKIYRDQLNGGSGSMTELSSLIAKLEQDLSDAVSHVTQEATLYSHAIVKEESDGLSKELSVDISNFLSELGAVVSTEMLSVGGLSASVQDVADGALGTLRVHVLVSLLEQRSGQEKQQLFSDHLALNRECRAATNAFWKKIREGICDLIKTISPSERKGAAEKKKKKKHVDPTSELDATSVKNEEEEEEEDDEDTNCIFGRFASVVAQNDAHFVNLCINAASEAMVVEVKKKLQAMVLDLPGCMYKGFEYCLLHQGNGKLRTIQTVPKLQELFPYARLCGLLLSDALLYFRIRMPDSTEQKGTDTGFPSIPGCQLYHRWLSVPSKEGAVDVALLQEDESMDESKFHISFVLPASSGGESEIKPASLSNRAASSAEMTLARRKAAAAATKDSSNVRGDHLRVAYPRLHMTVESSGDGDGTTTQVEPSRILISVAELDRAFELYNQQCNFELQTRVRGIEQRQQSIPGYIFVALFVLGFNELMFVLTSPVLLLIVVFICYFFLSSVIMGKWNEFQETGPQHIVVPLQTVSAMLQTHVLHRLGFGSKEEMMKRSEGNAKFSTSKKRD